MTEFPTPTPADIQYLKANPGVAEKFDQQFGPGASASLMGTSGPEAPAATEAPPSSGGPTLENLIKGDAAEAAAENTSVVGDILTGITSGAQGAVNELMKAGKSLDNAVGSALEGLGIPSVVQVIDPRTGEFSPDLITQSEAEARGGDDAVFGGSEADTRTAMSLDVANQPVTTAGKVTEGITQFLAGFAITGKVSATTSVVGALARGAATDAIFFDPYEGNLQNFLDQNEWAIPGVTEALAVDPEDPEWEARLKNSVDGLATGLVLDGFVKGIKAVALRIKGDRIGGEVGKSLLDEADRLADEVAEQADKHLDEGIPVEAIPEQLTLPGFEDAVPTKAAPVDSASLKEASDVAAEIATTGGSKGAGSYVDESRLKLAVEGVGAVKHVYQGAEAAKSLDDLLTKDWFNYSKMEGPIEAVAMIDTMGKALTDSGALKAFGLDQPETLLRTAQKAKAEVASMLDIGVDKFSARMEKLAVDAADLPKQLVAGKMVLQTLGREITKLAEQVDNSAKGARGNEAIERKLIDLLETHSNMQLHLKGLQTSAARATSAGRIATADTLDAKALDKLEGFGGSKKVRKLAQMLRAAKGDNQISKVVRRAMKPGVIDVVNEYWVNSILSGFKTHMVNITSNTMNVALLPAERIAGGFSQGIRGQGFGQMREGFYQYAALRGSVMDSIRLAGRSFMDEGSILDSVSKVDLQQGNRKAITASTFGAADDSLGGSLINGMGKFLRLPSRALLAEDEFFKQITFRSRLKAQLMEAARTADFKKLGYSSKGAFIEGEFEKAFTRLSDLTDEWDKMVVLGKVADDPKLKEEFIGGNVGSFKAGNQYAEEAIRNARAATFTTPLDPTSLSGGYQKLTNRHPILRQITPFIQTPVNILSAAFDRTPALGLLRRRFRDQLNSADAAIRAEAQGRLATGVAITTAATMLAYEGRITGGGPSDRKVKQVWQADPNWQPYSINIGSEEDPTWVAFDRLDPHGFLFGIAADVMEMQQAAEMDPSFDQGTLFAMIAAAAANNVTSKTWLQGVADTVELLQAKDRPWIVDAWARNKTASFTPFSGMGGQLNQALTDEMKDARSYVDRMMQNVPGMSDGIPVRYSWLTGKPIDNPSHLLGYIRMKDEGSDPVASELRKLNYGFGGPDRKIGEIELSTEMYQDWNRLMGSVKIGGRTLTERLQRVIESDRYDLKRERIPDGIGDPSESHRVRMIAEQLMRYKEKAKQELMDIHPDLRDAHFAYKKFKRKAEGGKAAPGDRENLLLKF